jgi:hypothetical protein
MKKLDFVYGKKRSQRLIYWYLAFTQIDRNLGSKELASFYQRKARPFFYGRGLYDFMLE